MNLFTSVLAFVLIPLFFMALHWAGVLVRALTGERIPSIVGSIAVLGFLLIAVPFAFEAGARSVDGTIVSKSETIETGTYGVAPPIYHHFHGLVAVGSDAEPIDLSLSASVFDRLRKGETVPLRLVSFGPLRIARLAQVPWFASLPLAGIERVLFATAWLITLVALFAAPAVLSFGPMGRAIIVSIVLSAAVTDAFLLRAWWEPRDARATAEIRSVHMVRSAEIVSWFGSNSAPGSSSSNVVPVNLLQPYEEVELRFRPSPKADEVVAVDRADRGSAGALKVGQPIAVSYWANDVRNARMTSGRRTYAWRNSATVYGAELVLVVLVLLFTTGASAFGDRLRKTVSDLKARVQERKSSREA